jgi:phosphate acetyltransferase
VATDTYDTAIKISHIQPRLHAHHRMRTEVIKGLVDQHLNIEALLTSAAVKGAAHKMTPKQFLHKIQELARASRRHIVLPEGEEERMLRAAAILLQRQIVDLTLLGNEKTIRQKIDQLGLKLTGAQIIDPQTHPWRERFALRYMELRSKKAPTKDQALDLMADVSYFGTMMVQENEVQGMVSGSTHSTAHTLRPALEFVKTRPGVAIASSIFFMCLPDSVLVYGDCAVNPNPTAEELADIAIASAETARAFEIEPYVAMLSYSTGESGKGEDVDKVRRATQLVKERSPSLAVEGPIQYDAAVDPSVAKTKLPGSRVAGAATVFIFPDLDSGNNTYKAVQRSAHAIAVGPVMQGLRKPVNDLSRGCTVPDIVNTVAITAIQSIQSQRSQ